MSLQDDLWRALDDENEDLLRKVLESGVDLDCRSKHLETPLCAAAESESVVFVRLLVEYGANVNEAGYKGYTPLHCAVDVSIDSTIQAGGSPGDEPTDVIESLLELGANIHATNDDGETPVDIACEYKSDKVIRLLDATDWGD